MYSGTHTHVNIYAQRHEHSLAFEVSAVERPAWQQRREARRTAALDDLQLLG